jgi:DNA-binding beta-propeller fold protein YncE
MIACSLARRWNSGGRAAMLIGMVGLLLAVYAQAPAAAQPAASAADVGVTVARFDGATAVALDPNGRIYVADARRSAVVMLAPDGTVKQTFGGPGTRPGQFDAPADVDPTNGLTLWIADTGNGRLQHLSQDGQFLEALPVGEAGDGSGRRRPVFDASRSTDAPMADGEPVAIATTSANEPIAIDAGRAVVMKWDAQRRPETIVGGFGGGRGALRDPVALALDRDRLYVADRERAAILVYDQFGTYDRTLPLSPDAELDDVRALQVVDGWLWIASGRQVVRSRIDADEETVVATAAEPIVDLAVGPSDLYLLTESRLLRLPGLATGAARKN